MFLERFDPGSLNGMKLLTTLKVQSWPWHNKSVFRLSDVISGIHSLRKLTVVVLEETLSNQVRGINIPNLRYLEISGRNLRRINVNAFRGVSRSRELLIKLHKTMVEELPTGLFTELSDNLQLSIDLCDNRLNSLNPATFYVNASSWENDGTKLLEGNDLLISIIK